MSITFDPLASVNWTAPELLSGGGRKPSLTSDVYAFAMVIYEVRHSTVPVVQNYL